MILQKSSKKSDMSLFHKKKIIVSDNFLIVKTTLLRNALLLALRQNRRLFRFYQPAALAAPGGAGVELRNVEDVEPGGGGRRCCSCSGLGRWNLGQLPRKNPMGKNIPYHTVPIYPSTKNISRKYEGGFPKTINRWRRVWVVWGMLLGGTVCWNFLRGLFFEMVISGDLKFLLLMTGKIESFFIKGIVK